MTDFSALVLYIQDLRDSKEARILKHEDCLELADHLEFLANKLTDAAALVVIKDNQVEELKHKLSVAQKRLELRIVK